jgi:predicted ribosome quality control (RQC) complex YloA/Tae2 family protein
MGKTRFSSLDVTIAVRDLRSKALGLRVANVYDINARTYLIKLARPDQKVFLMLESGVRFHSTKFSRDKNDVPSVFCMKLRKHIRTKRLEEVRQLGMDRVVVFTFGAGNVQCHLIMELYAAGNLILTDENYKILTLLRTYKSEDDNVNISVGQIYPLQQSKQLETVSVERVKEMCRSGADKGIKENLNKTFLLGTEMIDHCLLSAGVNPKQHVTENDSEVIDRLVSALSAAQAFIVSAGVTPGYITFKDLNAKKEKQNTSNKKKKGKKGAAGTETDAADTTTNNNTGSNNNNTNPSDTTEPNEGDKVTGVNASTPSETAATTETLEIYDMFLPYLYKQCEAAKRSEFADFDAAVDEFFSKIEAQKEAVEQKEKEHNVTKKLDKVKEDQERRIKALASQEDDNTHSAQLIESNAPLVDQLIQTINSLIAAQMSWQQIKDVVKQEKKKGDPVASAIHELKLQTNQVVVLLFENLATDDEDEHAMPAKKLDIDLSLSALANATEYYKKKKKATEKKQKTLNVAETVMKAAEKKVRKQLQEVRTQSTINKIRKPYWFEKFNWFISSDGYVIVSGRDMQQNEMLYKRYMQQNDIYVHADLSGASTCIIKNPTDDPVPPRTLNEAGSLSVCYSKAWNSKILTSAYWVKSNQVSKTAPSGEYLTTGSFMIRGTKNYLPPSNLQMGLALLFRVADESIVNHINERKPKLLSQEEEDREAIERDKQMKRMEEKLEVRAVSETGPQSNATQPSASTTHETQPSEDKEEQDSGEEVVDDTLSNDDGTEALTQSQEQENNNNNNNEDEESDSASDPTKEALMDQIKQNPPAKEDIDHGDESDDEESFDESDEDETRADLINSSSSKYSISLVRDEPEEQTDSTATSTQATVDARKKKMSAHERRQAKRQQQGKPANDQPRPPKAQAKKDKQKPMTRGQKNKMKLIKKKYGDQDAEEREAMMKLLQPSGPAKSEEVESVKPKETKKEVEQQNIEDIKKRTEKRLTTAQKRLAKEKEEEEIRMLLKEEKLELLSDADKKKLEEIEAKGLGVNLAALTGMPKKEDILMYAVPVCAPYESLSSYKYKVKLTPGSLKKGKASKLALGVFLKHGEATERERELIKAVPEVELIQAIISDCKVTAPGLQAVQRQNKKRK